jgi:hypothetical protein
MIKIYDHVAWGTLQKRFIYLLKLFLVRKIIISIPFKKE